MPASTPVHGRLGTFLFSLLAGISGGRSGHRGGTGSVRIVSATSKNVDVNETLTKENETKIQFEVETEYVEENT